VPRTPNFDGCGDFGYRLRFFAVKLIASALGLLLSTDLGGEHPFAGTGEAEPGESGAFIFFCSVSAISSKHLIKLLTSNRSGCVLGSKHSC
jgi:hypothetical protein